jgi:hypothetical protein
MGKHRSVGLPDACWDSHEATTRRLYLKEKRPLEGRRGVIELMKRQGLHARYLLPLQLFTHCNR